MPFSISSNKSLLTSGQTVTYTITSSLPAGSIIYLTESGTSQAGDFVDGLTQAPITITGTNTLVVRTLSLGFSGSRTSQLQVRTGSYSGTVEATSGVVNLESPAAFSSIVASPNPVISNIQYTVTIGLSKTPPQSSTINFYVNDLFAGAVVQDTQTKVHGPFVAPAPGTYVSSANSAVSPGTSGYISGSATTTIIVEAPPAFTSVVATPNPVVTNGSYTVTIGLNRTPPQSSNINLWVNNVFAGTVYQTQQTQTYGPFAASGIAGTYIGKANSAVLSNQIGFVSGSATTSIVVSAPTTTTTTTTTTLAPTTPTTTTTLAPTTTTTLAPTTTTTTTTTAPTCGPYPTVLTTGSTSGTIWGSNPYKEGSTPGKAARHAGLVPVGTQAWIERYDPRVYSSYSGSVQNGVTSLSSTAGCGFMIRLATPVINYFRISTTTSTGYNTTITDSGTGSTVYFQWNVQYATNISIESTTIINASGTDQNLFGLQTSSRTFTLTARNYNGSNVTAQATYNLVFVSTTSTTTTTTSTTTTTTTTLPPTTTTTTTTLAPTTTTTTTTLPPTTTTSTTTTTTTTTLAPTTTTTTTTTPPLGNLRLGYNESVQFTITTLNRFESVYYTIENYSA